MRRALSDANEAGTTAQGWSDEELARVEREHPEGLSTHQVVQLFSVHGGALTEATFRKYVQLGLLPRSVRVGRKGKHRGSQGLYPASVIRQIELIRRLMAQGYTIQEIQDEFFFLGGEIEALAGKLRQLLDGVQHAVERPAAQRADDVVTRALSEARALADELIGRLRSIERGLAMRARMARAAV